VDWVLSGRVLFEHPSSRFQRHPLARLVRVERQQLLTLSVSARPMSGDAEMFRVPGGGVGRRPAPRLLVPWPAAGVERLRADLGCLRLEALMDRMGEKPEKPILLEADPTRSRSY
jgi:hypothetical protein